MTCDELVDLMLDFVGNELPIEQSDAIKAHLCGCQCCGVSVEMYVLTIRVSRMLPKEEPLSSAFEQRLRLALAQSPR